MSESPEPSISASETPVLSEVQILAAESTQGRTVSLSNRQRPVNSRRLYTTMLLFEAGLGGLALAIGCWLESPSWRTWDWSARAWGLGVLGTIPPVILLVIMLYMDWDPLARFRTLLEERVAPIFAALRWWQLLLLAAAAGWGEELLFRGLLQPLVSQWLGTWGGVVLLAVIFGMAHALSRLYFVLTLAMSLYLSWLLEATHNLVVPILVHGLYDATALLIMQKDDG
jgi:membrane protease YdiL (CAAX protease family)